MVNDIGRVSLETGNQSFKYTKTANKMEIFVTQVQKNHDTKNIQI